MSYDTNESIYVYGLREILLLSEDGQTEQALPAAQTLTFTETITSDDLRGDDVIVSTVAFIEGVEFTLESGGISLDAFAFLTGETKNEDGLTPDRVSEVIRFGAKNFPWLRIYGRAFGDGADDLHVMIMKAKLTALEGNFANQQFLIQSATGSGIADVNNHVYVLRRYETATPLTGVQDPPYTAPP